MKIRKMKMKKKMKKRIGDKIEKEKKISLGRNPYSKSLNKWVNCPWMSPQILIGASSSSKLSCWTKYLWKKHNEAWSRSRKAGPVYLPSRTWKEKKNEEQRMERK